MSETLDFTKYVPCLRWKQGEYQALLRTSISVKDEIVPLIEVSEIGWDFEEEKESKSINEHLLKFAQRVHGKWGERKAYVDMLYIASEVRMANGEHPLKYVFDGLRKNGSQAIPVLSLKNDSQYMREARRIVLKDKGGICLRLNLEQLCDPDFESNLHTVIEFLELEADEIDLLIDLNTLKFDPMDACVAMVHGVIQTIPTLDEWRTYTILGSSFPYTMASMQPGIQQVPRLEWLFYKTFINSLESGERLPAFGDYCISHPAPLKGNPKLLKPSANIRYTIDDAWAIVKGLNVKDNGFGQFQQLSARLISSGHYLSREFSMGDDYIFTCASGQNTGNLTTWRWVGTNHHIEKVVQDLAIFHASLNSSTP